MVSFQETKREVFDRLYIKKFRPASLDSFYYLSFVGTSGGIVIVWKSAVFEGNEIFQNSFSIVEFTSMLNGESWILTTIYVPCDSEGKFEFMH